MNISSFIIFIKERFSLRTGKEAGQHTIQQAIEGSSIRGSSLWILLLAIIICSIGLNTNSTTVVIGAMLISPLMGPIIGLGVGLAIYDSELIKKGLRNLVVAFILSLVVSSVYFIISPLTSPTKEILARISPMIWDVIIAFAGGLVGAIALTRKEKSLTYLPGVAIATALMPPLCVTGYRLTQGNILFALKSFYLLFINSVFIAGATFLIAKLLHLPKITYTNTRRQKYVQIIVWSMIILTMIPSTFMTTKLLKDTFVNQSITTISDTIAKEYTVQVLEKEIDQINKKVSLRIVGSYLSTGELAKVREIFSSNILFRNYEVFIRQGVENDPNRTQKIITPLLSNALENQQENTLMLIKKSLEDYQSTILPSPSQLLLELQSLNESIVSLQLAVDTNGTGSLQSYTIVSRNRIFYNEQQKIIKRLSSRLGSDDIIVKRENK